MFRIAVCSVILFIGIAACAQNEPDPNSTSLLTDQTETTDPGHIQINNPGPRKIDETGDTWDTEKDKRIIKNAAERMPRVQVNMVQLKQSDAIVSVSIDEAIHGEEEQAWIENIKSAIEAEIQRYNIQVIIE
ncbi:hypothetical protein KO561_17505 [Radiobacillus kanasensis]|uniref:hypothetical protein n=1 Tax=Radiobacillus kanasensis TaxID=2844358 RepID=UPI001E52CB59|nr:hypothetical protein [Radiobacillus kanasensis]UFT98962.1 hypothetical protein KO561_17505 [Radiobacillus kanasensis]